MKKRTLLTALAFLALLPASSQTREEALAEFDWFTGFVSRNYPGYRIKTQGKERKWKAWTDSLRNSVAQRPDTVPCLIDEYIQHFKDRHLWVNATDKGKIQFQGLLQRVRARYRAQHKPETINMYYTAKPMNDSTYFLRIPSFRDSTSNQMIKDNWEAITSRPYLIVDLRCNSGGNDQNFDALMSLTYSGPYLTHGVEQYATPDFLDFFKDIIAHEPQSEWRDYLQELTDSMENHLGDYVLRPGMQRIRLVRRDTVYQNPRRIGLLIHGQNASSAEQYILEAKESEKVVLFGNERTSGTLDLSNVFAITSPSGWLKLYIPTTRSCRWPDIVIDGKGITPQIPIPYEESRIEALQEKDGIGEEIRYIERVLRGLPDPSEAEQ